MARVLPLVYADVRRPFLPIITTTDAMGENEADCGGYGLVALAADEERRFSGIVGHFHLTEQKADPGPAFDWAAFLARTRELVLAAAP